mmetsp:Transcript_53342/g.122591  ORF Transcript_53342/g.122591 Transcript_53342/m.122591 type:complete len:286 (-) Transcript_53342:477-1334(-)|eukprot:CAMPEP_0119357570 /NCGR_PEP_ID=MMETSP1334-20130426/5934_1 /TAXON_ID=127549 /ORGANISM="Calcidiscus leptoporus, Strain RCC1130" /LENGTH=285 /DNA_ID=CAMNT_0007371849 /DNA_START=175 /DNA_END=1032 /DNA_ORIENTATION=+
MAFGEGTHRHGPGTSTGSVPAWAQRAQEPLVPVVHIASVKKSISRDVRDLQKASDEMAKLRKQKATRDVADRLLTISKETRQRARETSSNLRTAMASVDDSSSDFAALTALHDEFKSALRRFQIEAEAAAPLPVASQPMADAVPAPGGARMHVLDMQSAVPPGREMSGQQPSSAQVAELQAVALNEDVIAEREQGINNIHRTVNEVSEIFQDLALLVTEQGEHIDNIQTNIESAASQTSRGVRELAKANRSQKRARSRLCCLALAMIVLLVVFILVLKFAFNLSL